MQLYPHEVAIGILGDEFESGIFPDPNSAFDGKLGALEFLRNLTEQDFGLNCVEWRKWFSSCPQDMLDLHYEEWRRKELVNTRDGRIKRAQLRWSNLTHRRCPNCGGLCPEYRNRCWVCEHTLGRIQA